jgi:phosphoglycolate phosphatase/pyrophosphatase PpaX
MTSGVIFDLDGTLGDTLPVCFEAFRVVFSEFLDVHYDDHEIRAMFGPTEDGILAARIPGHDGRPMERYLEVYGGAHHLAPTLFPGMPELLDRLRDGGVPMAVVTGKGLRSAVVSLRHWGIQDRFHPVEAGSDTGNVKARNMQRVLDVWGVEPSSVVSVGDVVSDIEAARAVGIVPVAAAWASTADAGELAAARPDAVFERVEEFAAWLAT